MKLLHLTIIIILTFGLVIYNNTYADNKTTAYGGLVRSHQNMTSVLPSPPLETYPYTSKIFSVFQIDPEIIHPNDTSSIHIVVTNNANFTLYDVNLGESINDSKSILFSNIHKIDILNPNQTKTIYGTLHVSPDVQPTNYYDIWWNVIAKNEMGNMMESMQFHRNLPITQDLPQYYSGPVVITLESPLRQFKSGTVSIDVKCNDGFLLTIKSEDGSPACVKPDTKIQLLKIGWAVPGPKDFGYNPGRGPVSLEPKEYGQFSSIGPNPFPPSTLNRLVFFIKSNSTAQIHVQYTSEFENTGNVDAGGQFYSGDPHNFIPLNSSQITISSSPDHVSMIYGTNTTVVYTISTKNITSGLYWIVLTQICGAMPVAIDMNNSQIVPSDIPVYSQHCPAQVLDAKILGISGGTVEYLQSQELQ